jgi:guanosine-3',5'-bis(diphosphate) 3'-pyrophosphohydrolase
MKFENKDLPPMEAKPLLIRGAEGVAISCAPCCYPIPGDPIVGYFNVGHGLVIHTEACETLAKLRKKQAEKCIPVRWAEDIKEEFKAALHVEVINQRGALAQITRAISDTSANIEDITVSDTSTGYSLISLKVFVRNLAHLERVLRHLGNIPVVVGVIRK